MIYHRPFTPSQRRDAMRMYRSCRAHLTLLRQTYPPRTVEQREVFRAYRNAMRTMADELQKSDRAIDPEILNDADRRARWAAYEYFRMFHPK